MPGRLRAQTAWLGWRAIQSVDSTLEEVAAFVGFCCCTFADTGDSSSVEVVLRAETAEEAAVVKAEMVLEAEGLFVARNSSDEFL
ncbi:hypothetical protein Acr_23g0006720 [Actinidia rufa]|uniref:Uncharacterized protein n=1 Tax=Actinidia rufa TaxID=165716 RepID=A0A7J0GNA6_9ERIC|nr:hypothetical protein Acr_23g0006720 [Actinidia rufa]